MSTKKLAASLTAGQVAVLRAFSDFGPMDDTALTVYVHHVADVAMSSSGIRSRRAELVRKGLLTASDIKLLKSGRTASIHSITLRGEKIITALSVPVRAKAAA